MIDLRSDTVTRPTAAMRAAMAQAPVGDDVYGEDPTVLELERRTAEVLGHEAGLFCATGSLANLLGVRMLVEPGQEVLCDVAAHVARAEMGAHAAVHGLTMRTWPSDHGRLEVDRVAAILSPAAGPYLVSTAAVAVENTHNFGGGTVQPLEELEALAALCRDREVGYHLDGARLWNAHVATGVPLAVYGRLFDTVSVCFSKGLGAPVGSVLVSSAANIARARVQRKRLGAGWRQAGMLAAGALHALDHHLERLVEDHAAARALAAAVAEQAPTAVDVDALETNIVVLSTGERPAAPVAAAAAEQGVLVSALGPHMVRVVTHLDVTTEQCTAAGTLLGRLLA
ncbi:MAG: Low-specificity L-threonine aldolase [uncultured Friedmanniella sp.]|uniref:Low-specificity L-threonine aldolase n=1 Tax=uncultured Friedmanniella sp. TaxID=335381 RepID=A0A6J4JZV1_9ACTN|nr:GntG family PLP-dependent aldolase [uncultured Friedmanniella sp.]CAA9292143.1 MAG: Low-specificity L-threonine aldolase [uncultured Friedmanniella sp.]